MRYEDVLHVVLGERQAELLQVLRVTTEQGRLAPVQFCTQYQAIQAIVLGVSGQDFHETLFEALRCRLDIDVRTAFVAQVEHLYPEMLAVLQCEFVRVFGVNFETHAFEDRQGFRQRQRLLGAEDNEMQEARRSVRGPVQLHGPAESRDPHLVDGTDVAAGVLGVGLCLVAGRKDIAVDPEKLVTLVVAEGIEHFGTQLVRPADDNFGEPCLDIVDADAWAFVRWRPHDGMQACERGVRNLDAGIY